MDLQTVYKLPVKVVDKLWMRKPLKQKASLDYGLRVNVQSMTSQIGENHKIMEFVPGIIYDLTMIYHEHV